MTACGHEDSYNMLHEIRRISAAVNEVYIMNTDNRPIGVLDSGLGGISVLRELVKLMPGEDFLYYGDSANAPYGTRTPEEVIDLTKKDVDFLLERGAKAIVVACNTATSVAIRELREEYEKKDIPVIGTHVWPAQAAVHAGMKYVVNAIPDNWPMALHLSEGSVHTIQCHNSYMGYRILNGMNKDKVNKPMPSDSLVYTGHYIDHELVQGIEADCAARIKRKENGEPMRFLLTIGGAGAQKEIFAAIIKFLLPYIEKKQAALYVNVGDYKNVWESLLAEIPEMKNYATEHFDCWADTEAFAQKALDGKEKIEGIHGFWHKNIFEAVYCTNLLMRSCDVLVTKPSELAFYPVPKLFIRRVGKHEMWGAIHSAEVGDGTLECRDIPHTIQMLELFLQDDTFLSDMCQNIVTNKKAGLYDGAYKVVELAMGLKNKQK